MVSFLANTILQHHLSRCFLQKLMYISLLIPTTTVSTITINNDLYVLNLTLPLSIIYISEHKLTITGLILDTTQKYNWQFLKYNLLKTRLFCILHLIMYSSYDNYLYITVVAIVKYMCLKSP